MKHSTKINNTTIDLEETPSEALRLRVFAAKPHLKVGYRKNLYALHPELATAKGKQILNNVLSGKRTHLRLTEILESMAYGQ